MALIICPECGKEISDKAGSCPNCGCPIGEEKVDRKKVSLKWMVILCIILLLLTFGMIGYRFIINPIRTYNDALEEYKKGQYDSALELLKLIPDYKKTESLKEQISEAQVLITYNDAVELYNAGNWQEALELFKTVPDVYDTQSYLDDIETNVIYEKVLELCENNQHEEALELLDSMASHEKYEELKNEIILEINEKAYIEALELLEQGRYEDATTILDSIVEYKNVKEIQEQMKYESYAYSCIKQLKTKLKNPDSLVLYDVTFYKGRESKLKYPTCIIRYGAQNGFGGNSTGYSMFSRDDTATAYEWDGACDTLDTSSYNTKSSDLDELVEYLYCVTINAIIKGSDVIGSVDLNRLNTVLKNEAYSTIKIIE